MTQEANAWTQDFTYLRTRSGMYYGARDESQHP